MLTPTNKRAALITHGENIRDLAAQLSDSINEGAYVEALGFSELLMQARVKLQYDLTAAATAQRN